MSYYYEPMMAAQAGESERAAFIRRTYGHLAGAILGFVAIEAVIFNVLLPDQQAVQNLFTTWFSNQFSMLLLFGGFIAVGWLARMWASSEVSPALQYLGLVLYVVAEAIIFVPILCVAIFYVGDPTILPTAGIITLSMFLGLTAAVLVTGKDFSFLRSVLMIGSFVALGFLVAGLLFQFPLGLFFSFAMVALACGFILYDTSNVMHHYRTDQHVAAALALFASVALLFFYVLRILLLTNSRD